MKERIQPLLDLYTALQECLPSDQEVRQSEFENAIKAFADKAGVNHWELSGFVKKVWFQINAGEDKRKGRK